MFANTEALSRASHELRTPLNAILGFSQLLSLDELNESQRHSVDQIMAGGRHLLTLIEDLLDYSRLNADSLERRLVEIGAQIADAASLCSGLADERGLSVTVDAGDEPLWLRADPRRLKQVLLNLISNAIKYNRPNGSITVRARPDGADGVRVDVIDSGIGMTYGQLTRLFQPFERLDAPLHGIEGNGLGLVVSKALIEAMDGTIDVASSPGSGSVFSIRLLAAEAVAAEPALALPAPMLAQAA
jgi:signal transduction histidine kinase